MKHFVEIHQLYNHKTLLESQKEINEMVLSILSVPAPILDVFCSITNVSYTFRRFLPVHTPSFLMGLGSEFI